MTARLAGVCGADGNAGEPLYVAWSEDVEPPFGGWRPYRNLAEHGPPPAVVVVPESHERIEPDRGLARNQREQDVAVGSWLTLLVVGMLLWATALRCGLRVAARR